MKFVNYLFQIEAKKFPMSPKGADVGSSQFKEV